MDPVLKILGKASSINVRKVLWTCEELGIAYEREDWGSGFASTHSPEFLRFNPNAQVPVIIDGTVVLWESNTICRYLTGKHHNTHLLPHEPLARARVEQWMDWQATDLNSSWSYAFSALVRKDPEYQDPHRIAVGLRGWNQKMDILAHQLSATGAFVTGSEFTLADIVVGLSVNRWLMTPMERPDFPVIDEYFQRLAQRQGFLKHGCNGLP
ncbi:glutathione S-transferase [Pseudomonas sp. B21-040]|jgi:glutathione S-transferase|uniref:glutathione S-transferase family protein n=1 Tax=Pseudomonas TaxID=286 RepID=UPI0005FB71D7|nr:MULTISPECIES: glutathione S-transferase [Pseudomonas]KJZ35177.1 glutathione S-transferase [Pseudomonas fluorescens]OOG13992.1 glutathione S-transferase [Pseudomonas sp. C9]PWK44729.1 glutathione S-transferase [Pseudomonas sp. OV226]UVL39176.1 glutathione S-transferase [Pseudomonas sp. B21-040]